MGTGSGDGYGESWPPDNWWQPDPARPASPSPDAKSPDAGASTPPPPPPPPPSSPGWPPDGSLGAPLEPLNPTWPASGQAPPPPPPPPPGPFPSVPHHHGSADRTSLAVAALVLVVFCGAIGFAIGRATAPKQSTSVAFPSFSPYTYRTLPSYTFPSYTSPRYTYPAYTYPSYSTPFTRSPYNEDPSGNTYSEPGVFTITFPTHHTYAFASSFSTLGTYARGHVVESAGSESPRGLYIEWTDPLDITGTSQAAATLCQNRYASVVNPGPATIAGRDGYTCRIAYNSAGQTRYTDIAYLFANKRVFIFETSELAGATYAQFLAFVASFRLS